MTHTVHLQGVPRQHAAELRRAVRVALRLVNAGPGSLTLRLTDEAGMLQLNTEFAHTDGVTDVLSFPDGSPDPDGTGVYYGDIVIALPVAASQAGAAGHSVRAELVLLSVHGTLHLLGHDHADQSGREVMWSLQDRVLRDVGCLVRSPQGGA